MSGLPSDENTGLKGVRRGLLELSTMSNGSTSPAQPVEKVLNKLNSKERHLVSSVLRKLIQAVRQSSYPLSAMADAINAASSPMPNNSADFVL